MLPEALTALAAMAGAGVVQAAGTDVWQGLRDRVARFFGRGDAEREQVELERLDQAAQALTAAGDGDGERIRARQEATWQTRFEMFLESLPEEQQAAAAAELRAIVDEAPAESEKATVHNEVSGGTQYGPVLQGRDFHGQTFATNVPPAAPAVGSTRPQTDARATRPESDT